MGKQEDDKTAADKRAERREAERQQRFATGRPAARVLPAALAKARGKAKDN